MKNIRLLLLFALLLGAAACKKENDPPPFSAAALNNGKAGIAFEIDRNFNGNKPFHVFNTVETEATNGSIGAGTRTIKVKATETSEGQPTRSAELNILLRSDATTSNGSITIDLSKHNGIPQTQMQLDSYGLLGYIRHNQSGTLRITRLTATEIEGSFTALMDDGMNVTKGRFAGKF